MRISKLVVVSLVLTVAACKSSSTSDKGGDRAAEKKEGDKGDKAVDKSGAKTQSKADYDREANQATEDLDKAEENKPAIAPEPLKLMHTIADQMCACTTAECAQHVIEANSANMETLGAYTPASTEEGNAMMEASKRMSDCAAKIPT